MPVKRPGESHSPACASYERLRAEVPKLHDARLSDPVFDNMPSIYSTLHGVIQHNLYHAGQIALLKKALGGRL